MKMGTMQILKSFFLNSSMLMQQDFLSSQSNHLFVLHFALRDHGINEDIFGNVHEDYVHIDSCLDYFEWTTWL